MPARGACPASTKRAHGRPGTSRPRTTAFAVNGYPDRDDARELRRPYSRLERLPAVEAEEID